MFNLFPKKKSVDELVDSVGPFDVYRPIQTPSYVQAQQDMIDELFKKNYELKKENIELKKGNKNWMSLYQEVVDKNNELLKEINNFRHLKKENVELIDRVNEIDSDVIRDLQDQLFTLKNDYAVLKAKHQIVQNMSFPNEVPYEWEAKPGTFTNEVQEFDECKITGYKIPKEKSWEEAASDLALRVVKLEKYIERWEHYYA
jgi:hypothetical protein